MSDKLDDIRKALERIDSIKHSIPRDDDGAGMFYQARLSIAQDIAQTALDLLKEIKNDQWVMVPREPTDHQFEVGYTALWDSGDYSECDDDTMISTVRHVYTRMIAAHEKESKA